MDAAASVPPKIRTTNTTATSVCAAEKVTVGAEAGRSNTNTHVHIYMHTPCTHLHALSQSFPPNKETMEAGNG